MRAYTAFLRSIRPLLRFFFDKNPGAATYTSASMMALLILCGAMVVGYFFLRSWRAHLDNPVTKKLSRSWAGSSLWFGLSGLLLVVCRVEEIQFFAMRFFWVVWFAALALYLFFQIRQFKLRHYKILPRQVMIDPRDKYLPGKKK